MLRRVAVIVLIGSIAGWLALGFAPYSRTVLGYPSSATIPPPVPPVQPYPVHVHCVAILRSGNPTNVSTSFDTFTSNPCRRNLGWMRAGWVAVLFGMLAVTIFLLLAVRAQSTLDDPDASDEADAVSTGELAVNRDRTVTLVVLGVAVIAWATFGLTPFTTHTRLSPITAALVLPPGGLPEVPVTVECEPLVRSRYRSYVADETGRFFLDPSFGPCHTRRGVSRTEWAYVLAFLMLATGVVLVAPRRGVLNRSVSTS